MSEKLKAHLAEQGVEALKPLLGQPVVDLLLHVGQEAMAAEVMAELIITSRGAATILRDRDTRDMLLRRLGSEDAKNLCTVLQLQASAPMLTIAGVNFEMPNSASTLFEWFGVPYEKLDEHDDFSRNVASVEKLRSSQDAAYKKIRSILVHPSDRVLLHMPYGAGKLRTVATAVLEAFRSEADGRSILWLAPDETLCEEAVRELETVWQQLGLRDVTLYRFFGRRRSPRLGAFANSLIVADIKSLWSSVFETETEQTNTTGLEDFGALLRHVVLAEAEYVELDEVQQLLDALSKKGRWNLIGISASPPPTRESGISMQTVAKAYGNTIVALEDEDPLEALRQRGEIDRIEVFLLPSPIGSLDIANERIALSEATTNKVAINAARNKVVLDKLHALSHQSHQTVFYATTAQQARMIAGLLALKGTAASAVTSEMDRSKQIQEIAKFNGDPQKQVLCLHGVMASSEEVRSVTALLLALPSMSSALIHAMIGRLASGRPSSHPPLHVYALADPVPKYLTTVTNLTRWHRLEVEE